VQIKHRLFYAGATPADCAAPRRRGTDGAGCKSSTGCSTPVRPWVIALPLAAVEQTALGDKPSTGCSTPVRPRLIAPPRAAVEQTALEIEPSTGGSTPVRSPPDRPTPRRRGRDGAGNQIKHRLFYADAAPT